MSRVQYFSNNEFFVHYFDVNYIRTHPKSTLIPREHIVFETIKFSHVPLHVIMPFFYIPNLMLAFILLFLSIRCRSVVVTDVVIIAKFFCRLDFQKNNRKTRYGRPTNNFLHFLNCFLGSSYFTVFSSQDGRMVNRVRSAPF